MATKGDDVLEVKLSAEVQALICVLATHALAGAREALQRLRDEGHTVTEANLKRVVSALRVREFCSSALVLGTDPEVSNEQLIEAARAAGAQAVREAGPFLRMVN